MSSPIAHDGAFSLYKHELQQYRRDSKRALASRGKLRRNLIKGHLSSILNSLTLPNSTASILALVSAGLLASHCAYA